MAQKKSNKVSVATIEKIMKDVFPKDAKTFDWYGVEIEYKDIISMEHMVTLVDEVTKSCFDKDGNYLPEFKDFLVRTFIVQMFSNVRLPQDIKKQYEILFGSDLFDVLIQHIDNAQYQSMLDAIDKKIEYQSNADVVATKVTLNQLLSQFQIFGEQLGQVNVDDIRNVAGAINAVDLDEEKLVQAIINNQNNTSEEAVIEDKENNIISIHGDDD